MNVVNKRRPRMISPSNSRETHHMCLGGEDELRQYGPMTRHCVFKNMCLKVSTKQWLYYSGSKYTPRVVGVSEGKHYCKDNCPDDPFMYTDFESAKQPLLNLFFEEVENSLVTPIVVNDIIPENAYFENGKTVDTMHLLVINHGPNVDAFGHILSEYIYPLFHGLDLVGVEDRDVELLLSNSPCPDGKKCSLYFEAMKSISKYYSNISEFSINYPPKSPKNPYYPDLVCYKLLFMGSGQLHGSSRIHHPDSWGRFVEKIIDGMGFDPFYRPKKQRILLINKGGNENDNRVAFNGAEVAGNLQKLFNVEVDYFIYNGETFRQEVEMVQQYTVCITVCGGTAFSCTFLPDGAANIYISTWYSEKASGRPGKNNNMDHVTWTYDRRHKYYAYPVWLNETTPDMTGNGYSKKYKYIHRWKHNKGFIIDFPRMAVLVNDALSYTEGSFGYVNSFKRIQSVSHENNKFKIVS